MELNHVTSRNKFQHRETTVKTKMKLYKWQ